MSVISAKEIINRSGDYTGVHEKITRAWDIVVDSPIDSSRTIGNELFGSVLPLLFDPHPENAFATARSVSIKQQRGLLWRAIATYSTEPLAQSERERSDEPNPINRNVKISWNTVTYDKAIVSDINNKGVVNSAGDYYDPPPSVPWERVAFHFRKNYSSPQTWVLSYCNSVNNSDISILGIKILASNARFSQPNGSEEQEENGVIYYETSWDIEADVETWQLEILDEGLRKLDASGDQVAITDANGNDITSPVLLDGTGGQLANPSLDNAVFNVHKVYYEKDYLLLPGVDPA